MPGNWRKAGPRARPHAGDPPSPSAQNVSSDGSAADGDSVRATAVDGRVLSFAVGAPRYGLDRVVLPASTKREIETVLSKVRHHQILYETWNLRSVDLSGGRTNINLYGPPGTGKTLCAEAIAHELGKSIIKVNYAEIESKYVGESPKNIKAAFSAATAADAVIFFDEADSILGRRLSNVSQSADHGVNVSRSVMLLEMDRFSGVTVFASNFAENYDSAFTRRILAHVRIPLPDLDCRRALWALHLPPEMPVDASLDVDRLAEVSDGLSGADILNAVIQAASAAVRRPPDARIVLWDDLDSAVRSVRDAKDVVGAGRKRRRLVEEVDLEDAPDDVRRKVKARREAAQSDCSVDTLEE